MTARKKPVSVMGRGSPEAGACPCPEQGRCPLSEWPAPAHPSAHMPVTFMLQTGQHHASLELPKHSLLS